MWDEDERAAWLPPEKLDTSEWAEKYRILTRRQTNQPGQWLDANQPVLRGFMKLTSRPGVNEIWVKKYGQGGWSEACRNVIGRRAHLCPSPVQLILPNRDKGREIVRKRIIPLMQDTPVLAEQSTGRKMDEKMGAITLRNGFELSMAYAGSPTSIASDPFALCVLDEVDKYNYYGDQADPIGEARARTRTFGDLALLIGLSTPSTQNGKICIEFEASPIKLFYYAPCPHCGTPQRLVFDNLRWRKGPKDDENDAAWAAMTAIEKAAWIQFNNAAYLRCADHVRCAATYPAGDGKILDRHKRGVLIKGYWGTADCGWRLYFDGREEGTMPEANRIGMQISALYDVHTRLSKVAAEFVAADGEPKKLQQFYNLTLGEEFRLSAESRTITVFDRKSEIDEEAGRFVVLPPRIVPVWASRLLLSIDTQKDYFWWVARAWGYNYRSVRVDHGRSSSFADLEELIYGTRWPYEGDAFEPLRIHMAGIDTGGGMSGAQDENAEDVTRTDEVYQWCNLDPMTRLPLKGASKPFEQHIQWRSVTYQDPMARRDPYEVRLHLIDPLYWRDLLDSYVVGKLPIINEGTGEVQNVERWGLNAFADKEYNGHMANVHKVQFKRAGGYITRFMPKTSGARHDYHDCETYNLAMAHGPARCGMLPTPREVAEQRRMEREQQSAGGGVRMPDGRAFLANRR